MSDQDIANVIEQALDTKRNADLTVQFARDRVTAHILAALRSAGYEVVRKSDSDHIIATIAVTLSWQFADTEMSDCVKAAESILAALRSAGYEIYPRAYLNEVDRLTGLDEFHPDTTHNP